MYLLQFTSGVAKDTIKCCLVMDSSLGYQKARNLLEERFGHPFTIASKYVTKLTEGPPLKPTDRSRLLAFADQLKDCEHTLESIGYLDENNSEDNLRRIVQRLPFHLRTKFIEVSDQIQQAGQRTNTSHIADFVKVKARAANNPVFGCLVDVVCNRPENQRHKSKPRDPHYQMNVLIHSTLKKPNPEREKMRFPTKKLQPQNIRYVQRTTETIP